MIKISGYDPAKQVPNTSSASNRKEQTLPSFNDQTLSVDLSVANKLNQLKPATDEALRVYITGGGCSGFKYCFKLDNNKDEDDTIIDISQDYQIIIDSMSISFLEGAMLMWKEDLDGARFLVENPNAETTCSCGASFALA